MNNEKYKIIDTFLKQTFEVTINEFKKNSNITYNLSYKFLKGETNLITLYSRYVLYKNKNLIFTLIDLNSELEYDCLTPYSIFNQLNVPYNEQDGKYVSLLKSQTRSLISIGNHNLYLKGFFPKIFKGHMKYKSEKFIQLYNEQKQKEKIKRCLQRRIISAVKSQFTKKLSNTFNLIGCDILFLKKYIETQFLPGMNWENHGIYYKANLEPKWHIDHIIPCDSFDLTKEEEQKKCFHYTNLRPLWAIDNLKRKRLYY